MRTANLHGRLALIFDDRAVDVEEASGGRFAADPQAVFERWDEFRDWAADVSPAGGRPVDQAAFGAPVPRPRQVFAIGLNYADHVAESNLRTPEEPAVFTKFVTSLTGPYDPVALPSPVVDWEVELVAVIGRRAEQVRAEDAWSHVAGLTVGQDLSERHVQLRGPAPQFSLGKSFPGFGPLGPVLVTPDELEDPDDVGIGCAVDGETMQHSRTSQMIFPVSELIARLSAVCPLLPGDLVFTGTPAGVGGAREPRRFLAPGQELHSWIDGIGALHNRMVSASPLRPAPQ
ncbi:fumarylacetoacetate hydrolase family protein [Streptomyces sp. NPDC001093]|uniref:fumarylacetoacetate hydrolase family protein n=1 Tax=Streptomyces sp. NPDC001093 TaxID=3154376 RepID=UPI003316D6BE